MNNSHSSKVLGAKNSVMRVKEETGKININELLMKKKSYENGKKEKKETLWKQSNSGKERGINEKMEKMIRF